MKKQFLIGIDVGGTFTHAVAVQQPGNLVVAHSVTPTTHFSKNSVSDGIIIVFKEVLEHINYEEGEIAFVAHSTTQATNALLEGDVSKVGVLGMGKGLERLRAKADSKIENLELSTGKYLFTENEYLDTKSNSFNQTKISSILNNLRQKGCEVIVASEAFSVDKPQNEDMVVSLAMKEGILATASHEISQLYGLKIRTRTAVVNASILPKMTSTALLTDKSIKESGIQVPLMIMRSDGGVMDLEQMKKRPILTLLSGPAAGISAALMYIKISDGIFLEVGGTSTDISAIKNGKAICKTASIGGHLTYLKTLDSRSIGIGGGSMVRMKGNKVIEVGPRSAHIANLPYIAYSSPEDLKGQKPCFVSPRDGDPSDYLVVENKEGKRIAVTLTDAAIVAGMVKPGDYPYNNEKEVTQIFTKLGLTFNGKSAKEFAIEILNKAVEKIEPVVASLIKEYEFNSSIISLVGGGGGATTVVPWLSKIMNIKHIISPKTEVISAIGAALAMLRDSVERSVINPTEKDIVEIRKEGKNRLLSMGAAPSTIEVQVEIDQSKNILRATATGSFSMDILANENIVLDEKELLKKAAENFQTSEDSIKCVASTSNLKVFSCLERRKKFFGLINESFTKIKVFDLSGVVKLQTNSGAVKQFLNSNLIGIYKFIEQESEYNDVGMILPEVFILYRNRIADFSTILHYKQIKELIRTELDGLTETESVVVLINRR